MQWLLDSGARATPVVAVMASAGGYHRCMYELCKKRSLIRGATAACCGADRQYMLAYLLRWLVYHQDLEGVEEVIACIEDSTTLMPFPHMIVLSFSSTRFMDNTYPLRELTDKAIVCRIRSAVGSTHLLAKLLLMVDKHSNEEMVSKSTVERWMDDPEFANMDPADCLRALAEVARRRSWPALLHMTQEGWETE